MGKVPILSFGTSETFRDSVHQLAREQRKSVSSWIRDACERHARQEAGADGPHYEIFHVADIGEDPLWSHKEALKR